MVHMLKPRWVIGSPPCTAWSSWNWHLNYKKLPATKVKEMVAEGRLHLEFMIQMYRIQLEACRFFLHEHPSTAASWDEEHMSQLCSDPRVLSVTSHQCEFGLTTPGPDGQPMPALKPTRWISNSRHMILRLSRRCSKMHKHQPLEGKHRTRDAEIYPVELCIEILRGIRDTEDRAYHHDDEDDIMLNHAIWVNSFVPAQEETAPKTAPNHKQTHPTTQDSNTKSTTTPTASTSPPCIPKSTL